MPPPLDLQLHHVAVIVTDMEKATWFYSEVLGLKPLPRPAFPFPGSWYELGDRTLHLIVHPPSRTMRGTRVIDPRDGHLAVRVTSFENTDVKSVRAGKVLTHDWICNLTTEALRPALLIDRASFRSMRISSGLMATVFISRANFRKRVA